MGDSHKDSNQAASCKELRATVAEIIRENFLDVEKECIKLDRYRTGKILKSEVRKVLAGYCNLLSMDQLNCLIQPALVDACNKVNYHQFLQEITGWTDNSERLPLSCTVDELESMLKYKIESNVANVLRGFYNYDCYKDGMIRKSDARRVLEHCCFKMTNSQFDSLWERYDPLHNNTLNYEDFLTRLGVKFHRSLNRLLPRDTVARNLCWRVPSSEDCHAKMKMQQLRRSAAAENITDPLVKGLSLDDTYRVFIRKLQTPGLDVMLTNGCLMFDSNNTGFILCEDFHAVLNHLVMPMSETLFLRLMERCMAPSTSARSLPWRTFIRRFCLSGTPLNQDPACQPYFDIGVPLSPRVLHLIDRIKRHICDPMARLASLITYTNMEGVQMTSRQEVRKFVNQMGFKLDEEEFRSLFSLLDPNHCNLFPVQDILNFFKYPVVPPCPPQAPCTLRETLDVFCPDPGLVGKRETPCKNSCKPPPGGVEEAPNPCGYCCTAPAECPPSANCPADGGGKRGCGTAKGCGTIKGCGSEKGCGTIKGCGSEKGCGTAKGCGSEKGCGTIKGCGSEKGCGTAKGCGSVNGCGTSKGCNTIKSCGSVKGYLVGCKKENNCGSINEGNVSCTQGNHPSLQGTALKCQLQSLLKKNYKAFVKACRMADRQSCKFLHIDKFQEILESATFTLTPAQWTEFLSDFQVVNNTINYEKVLHFYTHSLNTPMQQWASKINNYNVPRTKLPRTAAEILEEVRMAVSMNRRRLLSDIGQNDVLSEGTYPKDKFFRALNKIFPIDKEEFEKLWCHLPRDHLDQLKYLEFVELFGRLSHPTCPQPAPVLPACH